MSRSQGGPSRHTVDASHANTAARTQRPRGAPSASDVVTPAPMSNQALGQALGSGVPLDPAVQAEMEARFGQSFGDVRIHDDAQAHRSAAQLEAKAYTHGTDVAFSEGRYAPEAPEGKRLLAHELAHVVQQRRGGLRPALDPQAAHEIAADQAASAVARSAGPVSVAGATGVGVARQPEEEKTKKSDEEPGPVRRVGPKAPKIKRSPKPVTITEPNKAKGVLGEVTTPFELYSDPNWNVLGGGQETASSRQSLARKTRWGDTGGFDNLVEHRRTGRLVIGEQKRLGTATFSNATATTTNLEKNIANTVKQLRAGIKSGRVHPAEIAHVEEIIARLEQTGRAVRTQTSLPEEVVFELTSTGGKSTRIGKDYISRLGQKYKPEFVQKLLDRTFIRDPKLAKAMGRDPAGKVGTNSDPHIVPAKDVLTPDARSELERLLAGKTPKEWSEQKAKEKQAQEQERKRAREAEKQARAAERERVKAEAKKIAEETRRKRLEELREAAKREGAPEAQTKGERRLAENQLKKQATQAGKDAQKKYLEQARQRAKAQAQPKPAKAAKPKTQSPEAKTPAPQAKTPAPEAKTPAPQAKTPPTQTKAPKELPGAKVTAEPKAPTVETVKPTGPLEIAPKGVTPKGVVKGAAGAAGVLAGVAGVKDIVGDVKEGNYLSAAGKATLLGLSFVGEAAPPLFAFGAIMNYWGPRHESIQKDSFEVGDFVAKGAGHVPLLGRSETFRDVVGGIAAANVAVNESIAYTIKDMGVAVGEGAEIVADVAEDAYDWLTEGPSIFEQMMQEMKRRGGD